MLHLLETKVFLMNLEVYVLHLLETKVFLLNFEV